MIVKEMSKTAWQKEQERIEALKVRMAAEDEEQQRLAKENLEKAKAAFEVAEGDAKVLAERVLFRAMICEQEFRERETGITEDMRCKCRYVRGRGYNCLYCERWRKALYGGEQWVKTGFYNGFLC